jgi:hypothetical protein
MVEAFSGRIRLGPWLSPFFSALVVRAGTRTWTFNRMVDLWTQSATVDFPSWNLTMKGPDGVATLEMVGQPEEMVCLGYENPDGTLSYCLNSKLASVRLDVSSEGENHLWTSAHGGALEFLLPENPGSYEVV